MNELTHPRGSLGEEVEQPQVQQQAVTDSAPITVEMMTEAARRVGFDPIPGRLFILAGALNAMLQQQRVPKHNGLIVRRQSLVDGWKVTALYDTEAEAQAAAALLQHQAVTPPGWKPVAYVPVHPKNGPLWANTTADPNPERLPSYPLMTLYAPDGQVQQQRVPEGWKLTPMDPTSDMVAEAMQDDDLRRLDDHDLPRRVYRAMLAAAPHHTEVQQQAVKPPSGYSPEAGVYPTNRSTLDERVAAAEAEIASWSPEKRAGVQLQGGPE